MEGLRTSRVTISQDCMEMTVECLQGKLKLILNAVNPSLRDILIKFMRHETAIISPWLCLSKVTLKERLPIVACIDNEQAFNIIFNSAVAHIQVADGQRGILTPTEAKQFVTSLKFKPINRNSKAAFREFKEKKKSILKQLTPLCSKEVSIEKYRLLSAQKSTILSVADRIYIQSRIALISAKSALVILEQCYPSVQIASQGEAIGFHQSWGPINCGNTNLIVCHKCLCLIEGQYMKCQNQCKTTSVPFTRPELFMDRVLKSKFTSHTFLHETLDYFKYYGASPICNRYYCIHCVTLLNEAGTLFVCDFCRRRCDCRRCRDGHELIRLIGSYFLELEEHQFYQKGNQLIKQINWKGKRQSFLREGFTRDDRTADFALVYKELAKRVRIPAKTHRKIERSSLLEYFSIEQKKQSTYLRAGNSRFIAQNVPPHAINLSSQSATEIRRLVSEGRLFPGKKDETERVRCVPSLLELVMDHELRQLDELGETKVQVGGQSCPLARFAPTFSFFPQQNIPKDPYKPKVHSAQSSDDDNSDLNIEVSLRVDDQDASDLFGTQCEANSELMD